MSEFRDSAPSAPAVFYRSYSRRKPDGTRESYPEAITRTVNDLADIGGLTEEQRALCLEMGLKQHAFPSGRALWVAGTEWAKKSENFPGYYNCQSGFVDDVNMFGLLMELAMCGTGTGAVLELEVVDRLPKIVNGLSVVDRVENKNKEGGCENTFIEFDEDSQNVVVTVGDSRRGWVDAYQGLIELAMGLRCEDYRHGVQISVVIDLSQVRQAGEPLKGFGGVANPIRLGTTLERVAALLNKAKGRKLTPIECCLLVDEAASAVVAGNIRRCLPEDALVHTSTGLVPIKDVNVGDMVQTPIGFRRVVNKFDQGVQEIVELETNGPKPRATANHRVAVFEDAVGSVKWTKVSDLREGDRLMHSTQILSGSRTVLPPDFTSDRSLHSTTAKQITIPEINTDIAWLIGFTHGDGCIHLGRNKHNKPFGMITWATNSSKQSETRLIADKVQAALAHFGLSAAEKTMENENTFRLTCSSIRLAEYFYQYIKKPSVPIEIPNFILRGTSEIRAAYLAGIMDSDGALNNRPPHLVTTVYKNFARQIAAVTSSLGIACRTSFYRPNVESWQTKYHVTIPALKYKYNSIIAQFSAKGKLREGLKMYGFTLPNTMMRESYSHTQMAEMGFTGDRQKSSNYETYTKQAEVDIDIPVTFKGLGSVDVVQTYDIEVEEAHCFYCDGYLTHNSAGMRQFSEHDDEAAEAKLNLYKQDESGNWSVDPEREALRMANHTRTWHHKPTYEEVLEAVTKQYNSGEGAIQYVPEAIARANADLLNTTKKKQKFLSTYCGSGKKKATEYIISLAKLAGEPTNKEIIYHRMHRYGLNPCAEIILKDNLCNLAEIHLNTINPLDLETQKKAFYAGGLQVASLLQHEFVNDRLQYSRENDPIVAVSFTGLFDFFVHALGTDWLKWMMKGRRTGKAYRDFTERERFYLETWRNAASQAVIDYCKEHGIRTPNRFTAVQPAGSKSLLTGASSGWHPPKAQRFIRRITFGKHDPLVAALRDYGYSVIPAQSARDDDGKLLDDIDDPRVHEVLVEIPTEVSWANLPGADQYDLNQLPIEAQWGLYMQVQRHYTTHTTSATLEYREHEIETLAKLIHEDIQGDGGYISVALLARFDDNATFPRLPFEPIDKQTYDRMMARIKAYRVTLPEDVTVLDLLKPYDTPGHVLEPQDTACANGACLAKIEKEEAQGLL